MNKAPSAESHKTIKIALVGTGKISQDSHIPTIMNSQNFELIAMVDPVEDLGICKTYKNIEHAFIDRPDIHAVVIATPPSVRPDIALKALQARKHVMLEKPPAVTTSAIVPLEQIARSEDVTLLASWHSRYAPPITKAQDWLKNKHIKSISVEWRENIRDWHNDQNWVLEKTGLGVMDPGINALSILTYILPGKIIFQSGTQTIPINRKAPIVIDARCLYAKEAPVSLSFDFLHVGTPIWEIIVKTTSGNVKLSQGGARAYINGVYFSTPQEQEYIRVYEHFSELINRQASDVELSPLSLTETILQQSVQEEGKSFNWR